MSNFIHKLLLNTINIDYKKSIYQICIKLISKFIYHTLELESLSLLLLYIPSVQFELFNVILKLFSQCVLTLRVCLST